MSEFVALCQPLISKTKMELSCKIWKHIPQTCCTTEMKQKLLEINSMSAVSVDRCALCSNESYVYLLARYSMWTIPYFVVNQRPSLVTVSDTSMTIDAISSSWRTRKFHHLFEFPLGCQLHTVLPSISFTCFYFLFLSAFQAVDT